MFLDTAFTLEKDELVVGIMTPLYYGLTRRLMVGSHPVMDLLLVPNASLKYNMFSSNTAAFSFSVYYSQSFLDSAHRDFPGSVASFPVFSVVPWRWLIVTAQAGYVLDMSPTDHSVMYGGSITFLLSVRDVVLLSALHQYRVASGALDRPRGVMAFIHSFGRLHLELGVALGRFLIRTGNEPHAFKELPAYPLVDVWWRL